MLFNSFSYAVFLPVVFILYWLLANRSFRVQNVLLLAASYFFYGCWDWRFLFLLAFSTLLDYFTGLKIFNASNSLQRKAWLVISVVVNLGFLFCFKYYNFFADSFAVMMHEVGMKVHYSTLNVILPVGISFYTFHGLSYVFDIYNRKISPTRNIVDYTLFVSFFPLLVAGPIERATHLLPQVEKPRVFDYRNAVDGLRQILWGLFKKVVIADSCAEYVNLIFDHSTDYSGSTLLMGAFLFSFQIYGDFSGYSDIALGTARLFGFELLQNFKYPYFSRDIAEFWRRWHVSLSSWFRDYLYVPLGGSKGGMWMRIRNTFIIFLISGFWHGANWTFIVWGALNALFFIPLLVTERNRTNLDIVAMNSSFPKWKELLSILLTFGLTMLAWIFFRAKSVSHAINYLTDIFTPALFHLPEVRPFVTIIWILIFILIEWSGRHHQYALHDFGTGKHKIVRWGFYYMLVIAIFYFSGKEQQFIYFQF